VVTDRNRITGGGRTAGIDFALTLIEQLIGPEAAVGLQLMAESDPQPPANLGSPDWAPPELVAACASSSTRRHHTWPSSLQLRA
jgi:cyclohexyl-isocyanide hydratase